MAGGVCPNKKKAPFITRLLCMIELVLFNDHLPGYLAFAGGYRVEIDP